MPKVEPKIKNDFIRRMTFHLYKNQVHDQTHVSSIYRYNINTGEAHKDPFKCCKTIKDVKDVLLSEEKELILKMFSENHDFLLFKIDKRGLSVFQQIFKRDLFNSVNFIKEE